jgi:hypothetical protein
MTIQTYNTRQILVKTETTAGVDAAPVGASDSMLTFNGVVSIEADKLDRTPDRPFFGADPFLLVHKRATAEFEIELIGNATVGNSAPIAAILKACGMAETLVGGTSASYSFVSSGFTSATVYFYIGPLRCTMVYSMGTFEITQEIKSFNRAKVTMTGVITNATMPTENVVSGVTIAAFQAPPPCEMESWIVALQDTTLTAMADIAGGFTATPSASGGTLQSGVYKYYVVGRNANGSTGKGIEASATVTGPTGSVALAWTAITGATAHDIFRTALAGATGTETFLTSVGAVGTYTDTGALSPDGVTYAPPVNLSQYRHVNAVKNMLTVNNKVTIHEASELRAVQIMDRTPSGTLTIFEPVLAQYNPWNDANTYVLRQLVSIVGKQPGKQCTITMPNVQVEYAKPGNRDDAIIFDIPYVPLPGVTTGNDELVLKFT